MCEYRYTLTPEEHEDLRNLLEAVRNEAANEAVQACSFTHQPACPDREKIKRLLAKLQQPAA